MNTRKQAGHIQVRNQHIVWANEAAHRWLHYEAGTLLGVHLDVWLEPMCMAFFSEAAQSVDVHAQTIERIGTNLRTSHGGPFLADVHVERMEDGSELWSFSPQVSPLRAERLDGLSRVDRLTQLANHLPSLDELRIAVQAHDDQAARDLLAVCYIDIDGFRHVNDRIGRTAGDEVLRQVARRLRAEVPFGAALARVGGDEFALAMPCKGAMQCEAQMMRLLARLAEPIHVLGEQVRLRASVGVALMAWGEQPTEVMMQHAHHAVFFAKRAGGSQTHYFDAQLALEEQEEHEARQRIRLGMQRGEFILAYQPKVDMRFGKVIGVEALVRWQHPERCLLQPAAFVKLIENDELVEMLGDWVIGEAMRQAAEWSTGGLSLCVSVNISARHLIRHDFIERLVTHLKRFPGHQPGTLELEILETTAISDFASVAHFIDACKALGVCVAIDDFGTGYSSLTYLRQLPVDAIKLDQSFVRGVVEDAGDRAIVEGILLMAHGLGRLAIAEGVETVAHGEVLLALGCTLGQGYGIAKPMPPEHIPAWIVAFEANPPWHRPARAHGV